MRGLDLTALVLIIIGGINWGLVGLFDYNLVETLFGSGSAVARVIYTLVGLAALWAAGSLVPRYSEHYGPAHHAR